MTPSPPSRLRPVLVGFVVFVLAAGGAGFFFMSRWTEVRDALPPEAERAFAAALAEAGGGTPYIEISAAGTVVHRDQEGTGSRGFDRMNVLAWSAPERKIVRVSYPRWFVRLKTSSVLNLGTMIAALRRDWSHLDLSVRYQDLDRRGPGLLLDHRLDNGSRIMLWTTAGTAKPTGPTATTEILVTSEAGARMERLANVPFVEGPATGGTVLTVWPDSTKQTILGIGTSFTESSAFVLAHLEPERRREVMWRIFGADCPECADFTLARTPIGSCDFSVEGRYSYAEKPGDAALVSFTIAPDEEGFDPEAYPGVKDPFYDLLPMIREALDIKSDLGGGELRIIASAWTAPPWMKDIGTWYVPGTAENDWQGTGGKLKPEYEPVYADYLVKYLDAYADAGVPVWGLTPVNEPHGNGGHWESMGFSPESQNAFIKHDLGPRLRRSGHADTRLLIYDQNRDGLERWTDVIFADPETAPYVSGVAVHWYASTFKVYEDAFDRVHAKFPDKEIIHTEGCIDNLGTPAPGGVADPAGYRESGWFENDDWWWNPNATDWAYTVDWKFVDPADHPKYTPVHRYARNIIVSLDHWVSGWIDWNIVLDRQGGPNHVGNFCGAPIMIDTTTGDVYYTPVYWVLAQFSRTIRPGDRAVWTRLEPGGEMAAGGLVACATVNADGMVAVQVLNTTKREVHYQVQIGDRHAEVAVPPNAVQTVKSRS